MRATWIGCCSSPASSWSLLAPGLRRLTVSGGNVRKWGKHEVPRRYPPVTPVASGSGVCVETKEATMSNPVFAWIVTGVGVLFVLISAFADPLGLGRSPALGGEQTLGGRIGAPLFRSGRA